MLNKSKRIISVFMIMISLFCVTYMFAGCKKDKSDSGSDGGGGSETTSVVELTSDMISLEYSTTSYNRTQKKPAVVVKNGDDVISGSEYSVSYSNNIDIGTATATVSANDGSEVIKGSASKEFTITVGELAEISSMGFGLYTGEPLTKPDVLIENAHLGTDFTISWEYKKLLADDSTYVVLDESVNNFKELGQYRVTAIGKGNYQGTRTAVYGIYNALPELQEIESVSYDGASHAPVVEIDGLTENQDYTISYQYRPYNSHIEEFMAYTPSNKGNDFVSAGEYKVIVSGMGVYGGSREVTFSINTIELSEITVSSSTTYDGYAKSVAYSVGTLKENRDYQVSWQYKKFGDAYEYTDYYLDVNPMFNFIEAGEYKITASGMGNYGGTKEAVFVINKATLSAQVSRQSYIFNNANEKINTVISETNSAWEISYFITNVEADKNNLEAESWKVYEATDILDVGVYYIYAYIEETDNYNACTSTISSFEVYADELKGFVNISANDYIYDGTSHSPYPSIIITSQYNDEPLVNGQDYEIMWWIVKGGSEVPYTLDEDDSKNFVNAGYYLGRLFAKGNYQMTGEVSKSISFTISPASFDAFSVERVSYTYGQTPTKINLKGDDTENGVSTLGATIVYKYKRVGSADDWQVLEETTILNVGNYYVVAEATKENYNPEDSTGTSYFSVYKANLTGVTLSATDNDVSTLTLENYSESIMGGTVRYYYSTENVTTGGTVLSEDTDLGVGTYYVYAVISGMTNYNNYTTNAVEIIVSDDGSVQE